MDEDIKLLKKLMDSSQMPIERFDSLYILCWNIFKKSEEDRERFLQSLEDTVDPELMTLAREIYEVEREFGEIDTEKCGKWSQMNMYQETKDISYA